ncbi:hypothetical protein TIFTF001_013012 [Ficus carica]|uniref:Uncharacterized protein n=1 Tax=Ficus carica TaxID=3494 RepID=A0AA88D6U5_FICCA|nr:hypothetical protein TIFTF001_013012 [Ficus carica]
MMKFQVVISERMRMEMKMKMRIVNSNSVVSSVGVAVYQKIALPARECSVQVKYGYNALEISEIGVTDGDGIQDYQTIGCSHCAESCFASFRRASPRRGQPNQFSPKLKDADMLDCFSASWVSVPPPSPISYLKLPCKLSSSASLESGPCGFSPGGAMPVEPALY